MSYITSEQLQQVLDLPVSLPLTTLDPGEWLVVSSITIAPPEKITLRWLQSEILVMSDPSSGASTITSSPTSDGTCVFLGIGASLNVPNLGLAFVGMYRTFDPLKQPSMQAPQEAPLVVGGQDSLPPVVAVRALTPTTYSEAGTYSFVVTNNTTDRKVSIGVTGQIRLNFGI
jgi:hypothetical protein